jgi:hypothetical protein
MKHYHIPKGTRVERAQYFPPEPLSAQRRSDWEPFYTTRAVTYTEEDIYQRGMATIIFNLPLAAAPWKFLWVCTADTQ